MNQQRKNKNNLYVQRKRIGKIRCFFFRGKNDYRACEQVE